MGSHGLGGQESLATYNPGPRSLQPSASNVGSPKTGETGQATPLSRIQDPHTRWSVHGRSEQDLGEVSQGHFPREVGS